MQLESIEDKFWFAVFMRINKRFPENFPIGLNVVPKDEFARTVVAAMPLQMRTTDRKRV